jgi:glutaminase
VDAQIAGSAKSSFAARNTGYANEPPLQRFLAACHEEFRSDYSGAVADYIPELKRANPAHFGVGLVTIDGHVYEVGDSAVPFTIQSVSKAFVFALALDLVGEERVSAAIGVEPSGEAFNSIRLTNDNWPFNPMVNAGAIACSGLIHQVDGAFAFERIREKLSQFAGRKYARRCLRASTCTCSTGAPTCAPASLPTTTSSAFRRAAAASRTSSRFWKNATVTSE